MKKLLAILLATLLIATLMIGCTSEEPVAAEEPDVVTTASLVAEADTLVNGLSADGTWIVATLNDIVVDQEIIVEGEFHNKDDAAQDIYRKLGLYTQDEEHNIIDQFSLTAPKMTVKSENFRIQGGTFVGDVYVEANGFNVGKAATVDGNIYFATQEYLDSFYVDDTATVTGTTTAVGVDAVTTASIVADGAAVINGLSADGTWIVATLNDIVVDEEIIVDGVFHNKDDEAQDIYRKLGLYTQDEDHNIIDQFSLTAPKMTVKSENFRIQGGTFVGDVYVESNGFNIGKAATVDGNIYFAAQEYMDSFSINETGALTGSAEVIDAITTASILSDADALISGLSADGTWIVATLNDIVVDEEIIVEGEFHNKDDAAQDIYRKLGLYTQDEDHNIIDQFTLTAPKMTVRSENFRIQGGTFVGDVYVEANGFNIGKAATIEGNIYFAAQEYLDSFSINETGTLTGTAEVQ